MNSRKIELNEIKKMVMRGKKQKSINTKYEVAMSYFKQKQMRTPRIFTINFEKLIKELLEQIANAQIAYKCENKIKDELQELEIVDGCTNFQKPFLKYYSKEYPLQEIMSCLAIHKDPKTKKLSMEVNKNKQMVFFKHLRKIYPEFCFCVGEKIIIQSNDMEKFYELFKTEWTKLYERGRMNVSQKIEGLICRALYFTGALIENNIFEQIEDQDRKKKEENLDLGTKSQKKRNVKGITHQVSSTYSFGSTDMISNFSYGLKSQKSNQQSFFKTDFSQKSERIIRKERCFLWEKAQIGDMKITLPIQHPTNAQNNRYEVDLLSNDVENIIIQQAFKIQKLKNACEKNRYESMAHQQYAYGNYFNYYPQPYYPTYQQYQNSQFQINSYVSEEPDPYSIRKSFNFPNLVETRKTHSRLGGNRYYS